MERFWISSLEDSLRKESDARVQRTIHIVKRDSREDFMQNHLTCLKENGTGTFVAIKKRGENHFQWRCERSNKPKGKSSGAPSITQRCKDWSQSLQKSDITDRRFYVAPEDIKVIKKSFYAHTRMDGNDCISVDKLIKSNLQDNVVYYQPLSHNEKQPLIIIFSSQWQIEQLKKYGPTMIFLNATYKGITQYGFAFYAVLVKSNQGRGIPVAFFIVSEESSDILSLCLKKVQEAVGEFQPRCVMVDRDMKEINAVHTVFPYAKVLLCWFHVLQAVHRWIVRRDGGCSQNLSAKNEVIRSMIALKQCSTAAEFEKMSKEVIVKIDRETGSSVISQYLQDHWFRNADMWANFGRRVYHQDSETNNLVERFFFSMKYQFLHGYANRRVDELLLLLNTKVVSYYRYLEDLHGAQRISDSKTQDTAESALRMKNKGLQNNFAYKSGGHCTVPSEADKAKCYAVDLISMKCECAVSERGNLCKHIEFAKMMCKEQGIDIDGIRKELASSLTEQHCYEWDGKHLIVHCAGSFGVVHVQNQQCTCLANSLGEICVCLRLSELIGTQNPNQEVTDCFANTTANCQSHNKQLCVKKMISDLKEWCDSSDYKESPELNAVVKRAHQLAFGQYSMVSNKIKIIRLHAYRKRIERARSHAIDMHSYQLKEPLNRALYTHRPDSKFKVCSFRKRIIGSRAKNQILKSS